MKIIRLFEDDMLEYEQEVIGKLGLDATIEVRVSQTEEEIIANARDADVVIAVYEPLTQRVLESLPNLKFVLYRSIGFNSVDLEYATKKNLPVSHLASYCIDEVANYVVAAILMHNRRLHDFNQSIKVDKKWDYQLFPDMRRLSSLTVGLIGFGNIPRLISERLRVFGCRVIAYDPFVDKEVFIQAGVEAVSLEEVFAESDYISCHLPLNEQTKELLDASLFGLATKAPVFINSSRGGVVKEDDLVVALSDGSLSYAILDVVSTEDPDLTTLPFMAMENVLLTPHIAFYSQEAFLHGVRENMKNIQAFLRKDYAHAGIVNLEGLSLNQ
ncbi:C-terminal binding protein [Streptococcus sp. zg-86]|uniref:C-terminal binding protein n=1 Tax=Streptococcus zhangguiae TaxID=2664091 RepID=A0ABW9R2P5_9STRE|nr:MULTISPECIES: C-terminal binding protein [unclassified Streptococcus]MTB64238.1 C-terminal binding protein [Streptococcus sp. zg-86]MTB90436.1 C-terminal binding protein [Streptococcus sp. zg-36]QTH48153.1 C-terminal binding protein [Streptococcus sp. zg-86]